MFPSTFHNVGKSQKFCPPNSGSNSCGQVAAFSDVSSLNSSSVLPEGQTRPVFSPLTDTDFPSAHNNPVQWVLAPSRFTDEKTRAHTPELLCSAHPAVARARSTRPAGPAPGSHPAAGPEQPWRQEGPRPSCRDVGQLLTGCSQNAEPQCPLRGKLALEDQCPQGASEGHAVPPLRPA